MNIKTSLLAVLLTIICLLPCSAQPPQLNTFEDSLSYVVGLEIAKSLNREGFNLNPELVAAGYKAQTDNQSILSDDEAMKVMQAYQERVMAEREKAMQPDPAVVEMGRNWLAENGKREGVITTASGLQYKVLRKGAGKSPAAQDEVTVHYEGHKIDGTEFDNSYTRGEPATFPLYGVITGWQEGLQLMKPGAKYELYVPSQLGYGEYGMPPTIGPSEVLIFTVELISFKKAPKDRKTPDTRSPGR